MFNNEYTNYYEIIYFKDVNSHYLLNNKNNYEYYTHDNINYYI